MPSPTPSHLLGIDEITYGVDDLPTCRRFFLDWGLQLLSESPERLVFETLNGCRVVVAASGLADLPTAFEPGPTVREVVWGVADAAALHACAQVMAKLPSYVSTAEEGLQRVGCTDPNGMAVRVQVTRKRAVECASAAFNTWSHKGRVNQRSPSYERATPIEVGHIVFFVQDVAACSRFYEAVLGFTVSDRYPGKGAFLRCRPEGGHHDLFLLQRPSADAALNHVAFKVRDIHEVFGGGLHVSRCGWTTQLGPGRHPISSAYFWYFKNPAGALIEYYADEDHLTADWTARDFEPGPTVFAEWAIDGGIDGHTRRQIAVQAPTGQFLTDRK